MSMLCQPSPFLPKVRTGCRGTASVLLPDAVFQRLRDRFTAFTEKHRHLLVGVAKRSRVIHYLSVALGLGESFAGGEPSYLPVPAELEREAAPTTASSCAHLVLSRSLRSISSPSVTSSNSASTRGLSSFGRSSFARRLS